MCAKGWINLIWDRTVPSTSNSGQCYYPRPKLARRKRHQGCLYGMGCYTAAVAFRKTANTCWQYRSRKRYLDLTLLLPTNFWLVPLIVDSNENLEIKKSGRWDLTSSAPLNIKQYLGNTQRYLDLGSLGGFWIEEWHDIPYILSGHSVCFVKNKL